jgi:hypothetical protein
VLKKQKKIMKEKIKELTQILTSEIIPDIGLLSGIGGQILTYLWFPKIERNKFSGMISQNGFIPIVWMNIRLYLKKQL